MATRTTKPRDAQQEPDEVEMTMFGRLWRPSDWLIPPALWSLALIIATVVHQLQRMGQIPAGGGGFLLGCLVLTVAGVLCGLMLGFKADMKPIVTCWCVAVPATAGLWIWWVNVNGMVHGLAPWVAFVIMGAVLTVWYHTMRDAQRRFELALMFDHLDDAQLEVYAEHADELARLQTPAPDESECRKWVELLAAAGLNGMVFHKRLALAKGTGFVLLVELPSRGVTFAMVEQAAEAIELQLFKNPKTKVEFDDDAVHPGCVRIERAKDKNGRPLVGEILIYVDVVDVLARTLIAPRGPEQYSEMSITKAFPVGEFVDGTPIYLTIHEIHTLIIGQTQNGKSNLLHIMIRQLARCTDAVLWGLDFKGGDTLRLWMNPYMDGEIDPHTGKPLAKCIFDWVVVNDRIEAERMLLSALDAADEIRPFIAGGGGWVPSKEKPAIIFIADEVSEIVGQGVSNVSGRGAFHVSPEVLSGLMSRMFKLGTGQGVYGITASQRGTVGSVGTGEAKSQQRGRILLPVTEGHSDVLQGSGPEAQRLAKALEHKGSVVIEGWAAARGKPGKIWLAGHKDEIKAKIRQDVLELTHLRADVVLDPGTAAGIVKYGYAGRPGGPTPDPDRIAWYYGRKPARQLLTWDYEWRTDDKGVLAPVRTGGALATATGMMGHGGPRSTAEALGLADVPSVLSMQHQDPAPASGPAGAGPVSIPAPLAGTDRSAAQLKAAWEEKDAKFLREEGLLHTGRPAVAMPAEPVPDDPRPGPGGAATLPGMPQHPGDVPPPRRPIQARDLVPAGQAPTYENSQQLMIYLIHQAGSSGITPAGMYRRMEEAGHVPVRQTLYPWLERLAKDTARNGDETQKVIKEGQLYLTSANKPMPRKMAS